MKRVLAFEGAGMANAEVSKNTIGNCRVRTAFHLDDGTPVYLEMQGWEYGKNSVFKAPWKYTGWIVDLFKITGDPNDCNINRIPHYYENFQYRKETILSILENIGATFDDFKVYNSGVYRVFADGTGNNYNFGDMEVPE